MGLKVSNLCVNIGSKKILKNINIDIKRNKLIVLFGPNGSGKTTLLKTIAGINNNFTGEILINNQKLDHKSNSTCYISSNFHSIFSYLVIDFVLMGIAGSHNIFYKPTLSDKNIALDILKELNILHLENEPYNNLSTGEKQLCLIAKGLIQNSKFILFDEPISNLDFYNQHIILKLITDLTKKDKTIIVSLHDPNLAIKYFKNIIVIKEGEIYNQIHEEDEYINFFETSLKEIYNENIKMIRLNSNIFFDM